MAEPKVSTTRRGTDGLIFVLELDNPPANALTPGLRLALDQALKAALPMARGIVIAAAGRNFSAATSVDAAGPSVAGAPSLSDLCLAVEAAPCPVVAALHGAAIGPGAELALAAHARVAQAEARLALPEVGLGLCPEAGATQRLPRLVGAAEALDMLLSARPVIAPEAVATGLFDQIADGDLRAAAEALAAALPGPRPTFDRTDGLRDPAAHAAAVARARDIARRGVLPAPERIVDCVEAALYLPFENGLALETVAREDLGHSDEARALAALAVAERRVAALPPAVARVTVEQVSHLALCGVGPQMAPLAFLALGRGMRVSWFDTDASALAPALRWVSDRLADEARAGRLSSLQRDADAARLAVVPALASLAEAGLVVHARSGDAHAGLARLKPGMPQLVLGGAEGVMGLALAPSARASELALPDSARAEDVAAAVHLLRRLGLAPVLVGKMPVLGRRMAAAGRAALMRLAALGVPQRAIEAALDGFGQPVADVPAPSLPAGAVAVVRPMPPAEITSRWLAALANEGLRLLDARVARRPSDVDHVLVQGHGFPRWQGGPMYQAAKRGLLVLRADLRRWQQDDPLWTPHPLLDRMVADGRRLAELDT